MKSSVQGRGTRTLEILSVFVLLSSLSYLFLRLIHDVRHGGNPWKQGDWLINSQAGTVRRSLTGDFTFLVSDLLHTNPLIVLSTIQALLLVSLFYFFAKLGRFVPSALLFVLVCSPAFFPLFWASDPQGSLRKELIVFVSVVVLTLSLKAGSRAGLWGSIFLYVVAVFSHEALTAFMPLVLYLIPIYGRSTFSTYEIWISCAVVVLASMAAITFVMLFSSGPGAQAVCGVLIDYNLPEQLCNGAVKWLDRGVSHGYSRVLNMADGFAILKFLAVYVFCFSGIFAVTATRENLPFLLAAFVATGVSFFPLYFIAVDWGRWLSFHFFSFTILIMANYIFKSDSPVRANSATASFTVGIFLLVLGTPAHTLGFLPGGAVARFFGEITVFLTYFI
ncbi:hypothetical protein ACS3QZ_14180 [Shimia sp. W99]